MRLTKFLGRKCKVCMRILLLKSLFLGTHWASFLPILCGFLFVFAVDSFLFLPWIPFCFYCGFVSVFAVDLFCFCRGILFVFVVDLFCRGFLCVYSFFLFVFLPCSFYYLPRNPKNVGVFWEKVHRFSENLHRFLGATL